MLNVLVKRVASAAVMPVKATVDSACFDLHVASIEQEEQGWTVYTGLSVAIPQGHAMLIYPRSGLSTKLGLALRNGTGVIDSDYRGEIIIKLTAGLRSKIVEVLKALMPGSRIAQAMIISLPEVNLLEVANLPATERGAGGFGSTG